MTNFCILCIITKEIIFLFIRNTKMELPEQYQNLLIGQKRLIVSNLILQYWNKKTQEIVDHLNDDQVEFLFSYFFTESKEVREKMWNDMQKKYELVLKELEVVAEKLQKINLHFSELLASKQDIESFWKH